MNIIDLHCDTIAELMEDREKLELRKNELCIDLQRMKKANSMAQFFALFINLKEVENPLEACLDMADKFFTELEKNKENISLATNYEQLMKNNKEGKMSAILTIEEGGAIKGKLHNLRNFYRLGVRLITLTWNYQNEIGYPNAVEEYREKGLTEFGQEVVAEMNRLGMLIDVSHLSDGGFYDVARLSNAPFVASHSNARAVRGHVRNLTDDMIRILAEHGGVTGMNYESYFLIDKPGASVDDIVKHIKHITNVGGIDVVSLGSDFDGTSNTCELKHIDEMYKLEAALRKSGFSNDDIEKIFYKNALRVIKDVMK